MNAEQREKAILAMFKDAKTNPKYESLRAAGFHVEGTGGGCTAWLKNIDDTHDVLIASDANHEIDPSGNDENLGAEVSEYSPGGDFVGGYGVRNPDLAKVLEWVADGCPKDRADYEF